MREYFDSAKSWYYIKYIQSLRFIILTVSIISIATIVAFFSINQAYTTIMGMKAVSKVVHTTYDTSLFPKITKIDQYHHSNDLNILQYTIKTYITNFETYERTSNQHLSFLEKIKTMQNYSSASVIKVLQDKFNKKYATILDNGGFVRAVVRDVDFGIYEKTTMEKIYTFLMPEPVPSRVIVAVEIYVFNGKKLIKKNENIELNITFQKIHKQEDGNYSTVKFFVNEYKYL